MSPENAHSFVGRQPELTALRAELATIRSGRPRVVLLEGSPGIASDLSVIGSDRVMRSPGRHCRCSTA